MRALPNDLRRQLESAVLAGRRAAEAGVRASLRTLAVGEERKPDHLTDEQARLRRGLRAKQRQLGADLEVLVWECAYEQWHRLLFARFLAENRLLRHPQFGAPVTLEECEDLAEELGEPDGWSVAARFAAEILPGIFRLDDPCVQLRMAVEHRVALERVLADLPGEVFLADDSLGWVYQYWQSRRKDEVNKSEVKVGGADLGPVTQLFTENYMVRFLLENSMGAWWAARHPESRLINQFEFLRFDDDGQPAAGSFDGWPQTIAEVTVMDPCCGSGHFLVEAFGMLWRMRAEEEGLDAVAAQDAVLRDNLFGLELDPRCVQIAMFAVALSAWKQGGGWRELPPPNIACSGIPAKARLEEWTALADGDEPLEVALEKLHTMFQDADTLGSLIDPRRTTSAPSAAEKQRTVWDVSFEKVAPLIEAAATREAADPSTAVLGAGAAGIARAARLLSDSYTLIATNVPFLSRSKQAKILRLHLDRAHPSARGDLATAMVARWVTSASGVCVVTPQNWQEKSTYQSFRRWILGSFGYRLFARLGDNVWQVQAGGQPFKLPTVLSVIEARLAPGDCVAVIDIGNGATSEKALRLQNDPVDAVRIDVQRSNPESRILAVPVPAGAVLIGRRASCLQGTSTGDTPRYVRFLWELARLERPWRRWQSSTPQTLPFTGRSTVVRWWSPGGVLDEPGSAVRGEDAWGRVGVSITQMGNLSTTLYTGEVFDTNAASVVPNNEADLPALWAFCKSAEFRSAVRSVASSTQVTNGAIELVPFDVERWRQVAVGVFPKGLPEPSSDDPTQWLFRGCPDASDEPLQVGISRLVGYRWPEQPEGDCLDKFADADGIVCLPAVGGELASAERLTALLSAAFAEAWSPSLLRQLLEQAGSKKKLLSEWLRDDFFAHHCKVFSHRPFVWHIWDGRKDGFSAVVNYHRLDRAGLEKLTYTYLGDWIERQRADAAEEVAGAGLRLAAARELKGKLEAILEGEPPYDVFVRWKELHEQPIGWDPDLDDGVRLSIRPFVEAGVLRAKVNVHWKKDRGRNHDGSERHNDLHYTRAEKLEARRKVRDR